MLLSRSRVKAKETPMSHTLFDKIWDGHVIRDLGGGYALLHIDCHLLHDLGGPRAFKALEDQNRAVRNPELTFATPDHAVSTLPGRDADTTEVGAERLHNLRRYTADWGIKLFDLNTQGQGIVHIVGPEQGLAQPGLTIVCGDSHTTTQGALGALAWGIGSSEIVHVMATQSLVQQRPQPMRINFTGTPPAGTTAKDMILYLIGQAGTAAGAGYAVEFAGPTIRALDMEGRMTICNLAVELGARFGMIAPDDQTIEYLAGRPFAPKAAEWDRAVAYWRTLSSDDDAAFAAELSVDVSALKPQITWGTSPQDVTDIDGVVPDPADVADDSRRAAMTAALDYIGLTPGTALSGLKIDRVFLGSCTNSRISDLRAAAKVVDGRKVADHVTAWVVPGSTLVKKQAEAEGLDQIFRTAGFEWREPGCSMCLAANGEMVGPLERCVSTSNRNFVGRQGPGARTHLASPETAAASAILGHITDHRSLGD